MAGTKSYRRVQTGETCLQAVTVGITAADPQAAWEARGDIDADDAAEGDHVAEAFRAAEENTARGGANRSRRLES